MPGKAIAVIPARWASSRFPGKPLHQIAGKPLVQHVWERCRKARQIERVIIATDDERVADGAAAFGAEVQMTSERHRSGTDRVAEVAAALEKVKIIINVQGDEPLIAPDLIDRLAEELLGDRKLGMVTAASAFKDPAEAGNPNVVKVVLDRENNALFFSRSLIPHQRDEGAKPPRRYRHHGIYGFRRETLLDFVQWKPSPLEQAEQLEQLRALENGAAIRVVITKRTSPGVDLPGDVEQVERLLRRR